MSNLVPSSGHLVQMPSHIYIRVGRYHDAAIANQKAIAHLRQAVTLETLEDALTYDKPADWSIPVRQYLGAALLKDGRLAEAEQVYREDLAIYPDNGWSLFGLVQSLQGQGKESEAKMARQHFDSAWQYADVRLTYV